MDRLTGLIFLPLALIATIWFCTPVTPHNQGLDSDGVHYAAMVLHDPRFPELTRAAPYCWRPLTPWLISLVAPADPARLVSTMRALNVISAWIALAALHAFLRRVGLAPLGSAIGVLLYAGVFWTVRFSFFSPAYVDHAAQAFLMLVLWAAAARRWWLAAILVALAAAQKETIAAIIPVLIVWRWRTDGLRTARDWVWATLLLIAPLGVILAIRASITPLNDYSAWSMFSYQISHQLSDREFWTLLVPELSVGLGAMLFVLLLCARPCLAVLRESPHWAVMLAIGMPLLFAGVEKARLLLPTLPLLVLLTAQLLERAWRQGLTGRIWVVVTLLVHFYLGHHFEPLSSIDEYFARMTPLHGLHERDPSTELIRVAVVAVIWILATLLLQPFAPAIPPDRNEPQTAA